jgi:TonB family protein
MRRMFSTLTALAAIALFVAGCGSKAPKPPEGTIAGVLDVDQTWEGVIVVSGDVTVPEGVSLTIRPGTEVKFVPRSDVMRSGADGRKCEIIVDGTLAAIGTSRYPVVFTGGGTTAEIGDWYGITLRSSSSVMDHCVVQYAEDGITVVNASPTIRNSRITSNLNNGITCVTGASPLLAHNIIAGNANAGVVAQYASEPVLYRNVVSLNSYGVLVFDVSEPVLGDSRAPDTTHRGYNEITDNVEYNLYNHAEVAISAQNNFWRDVRVDAVARTIFDADDDDTYGAVSLYPLLTASPFSEAPPDTTEPEEELSPEEEARLLAERARADSLAAALAGTPLEPETPGEVAVGPDTTETVTPGPETPGPTTPGPTTPGPTTPGPTTPGPETPGPETPAVVPATVNLSDLDRPPAVISQPGAAMPEAARAAGVNATALVRFKVSESGNVVFAKVVRSTGRDDCDGAAVAAVRQWRFAPGTYRGTPVSFWHSAAVVFR